MRVLVTGATGFIGRALSQRLIEKGYAVKALAREPGRVLSLKQHELEILLGDIRDPAVVEKAVDGCEEVYHLAAATSWGGSSKRDYRAVNVEGTRNLARAARKAAVRRLVYASSVGVYGSFAASPLDESSHPYPDSSYRETKLAGESVVLSWHKKEGLPVVIARIATVFGPGSFRWLNWIRTIANGRFRFIGSGENHIHEVYISDVVHGLERCAESESVEGKSYILAGIKPVILHRLVETIAQELKVEAPSGRWPATPFRTFRRMADIAYRKLGYEVPFARRYDLFLSDRVFSISKAREELKYAPQVTMLNGMARMMEWYRERGYVRPSISND